MDLNKKLISILSKIISSCKKMCKKTSKYSCAIIIVTIWRNISLSILPKSNILNHRRLQGFKLFVVVLWTSSNQHWQQEACIVNDCRCAEKASVPWNHLEIRGRRTSVSWLHRSFIIYFHSMLQHSSL